jgi:hypothetical protein
MTSSPTLSYIGACDTSSSTDGSVLFNILFDSSIQLLMFEYAIQPTSSFGTTDNVVNGFIHSDTCTQSGINNQYILPIPAQASASSPASSFVVRVRVYDANYGTATEWSNVCNMYYPPAKPVILTTYYENKAENAYDDGLYVLFTNTIAPFECIVSYYYTDSGGATQWAVSPPSQLTSFTYEAAGETLQGKYLFIQLNNDVNYGKPIFVAAHAAYMWTDAGTDYYAISEVTPTVEASAASYAAPVQNPLVYNVYTNSTQSVNLSWAPPIASSLNLMVVDYYNVKINYQVGGTTFNDVVQVNAPTTTLQYSLPDIACGTTYNFAVSAVSLSGQETDNSNVESITVYKYPTAPTNLEIAYAFFEEDTTDKIDMLFSFTNPVSNGCGSSPFLEYVIKTGDGTIIQNTTVISYVAGVVPYVVKLDGLDSTSNTIVVEVYMKTTDTNSSNILSGPMATASYLITGVPYIDQVSVDMYNTLTFRVQTASYLTLINNVACVNVGSSPTVVNWNASENVISLEPDLENLVWVYHIGVDLPGPCDHIIINASNRTSGIGHRNYHNA